MPIIPVPYIFRLLLACCYHGWIRHTGFALEKRGSLTFCRFPQQRTDPKNFSREVAKGGRGGVVQGGLGALQAFNEQLQVKPGFTNYQPKDLEIV